MDGFENPLFRDQRLILSLDSKKVRMIVKNVSIITDDRV